MNNPEFNNAFAEQNRRDQIAYSTLATVLSMILNLACSIMDYVVYPTAAERFLYVRLGSIAVVALVWIWFVRTGKKHHRVFGVMWYASPLAIILWMIYYANSYLHDVQSPYYAGLNIVLLAVGVLSSWTYIQNLVSAALVLVLYVLICFPTAVGQLATFINNTTFLVLTAVIVVASSRANARQRLREFSLRWELDESRRAVEENNKRLVELDEAKSRFFANISHELRTPLTLLIAPLETLMHRHQGQLNPESLSLLQTMHGNSLRLLKLINDLLNIVRLESGKLQVKREPVVMVDFIKGMVGAARQMADDKHIQLETDVALQVGAVMVDRDKVEKTLLNLVFNALKFTPSGGQVVIRVLKEENDLVISVQDTGVGIPKEKMSQVFTRFWQADDSSSRRFQGVGIGLSLVKEFTELQGGSVAVESEAGKGSTFTVRLPYVEVTAEDAARAAATPHEASGLVGDANATSTEWLSNLYRRAEQSPAGTASRALPKVNGAPRNDLPTVLIADDEPDMLHFMASQLAEHYQVIQAVDGVQATEKAIAAPPDLILTDMMMPGKDGLEVCKELRAHPATKSVPIVMITARADEETKLAVLNAGANDFLPKPFSTTELHVRVKNLMDSYRFQRGLERQNKALESALAQLKQMQDQLVTKEKQASLGVWSAGIIHEMNNPLNFARTGLYALRNKDKLLPTEEQGEFREVMSDIEEGINRVHMIVSDLRTYAHPGVEECEDVLVRDVVRMVLRFFSSDVQGYAEVIQKITPEQTVYVNRNKLIQVLGNLLQNSVDALKTKEFGQAHPVITIEGREEGGRSKLILHDNGPGIEKQNLDKIFDPFFTTKDVGKGMGLGLGICYRIVQEFGGNITVRSEPGQFCEFTLDFPAERTESTQVAAE